MTNDRASATDTAHPIEPVSDWENAAVKGMALCNEGLYQQTAAHARALRDRQAAYKKSLPTDPQEAIRAALKLMSHDAGQFPEGIEDALHLSCALSAMIKVCDLSCEGRERDAGVYLASRLELAMHRATRHLERIGDILENPERIKRER